MTNNEVIRKTLQRTALKTQNYNIQIIPYYRAITFYTAQEYQRLGNINLPPGKFVSWHSVTSHQVAPLASLPWKPRV